MDGFLPIFLLASSVLILQVIYRVFFHPLRRFPGPWLAAATFYYRAYYDVVKHGGWMEHMVELHRTYGPVVRVTPTELHFSDPNAFDDIHIVTKPTKDPYFYSALATPDAVVQITDPKEASKRRVRLGSYLSRRAVLKLEKSIQEVIDKLIMLLSSGQYSPGQEPADLFYAYRSTTLDIIVSYLFAQEFGALDFPAFAHPLLNSMDEILQSQWLTFYLQPLGQLMQTLPESLLRKVYPMLVPLLDQLRYITSKIDALTELATKDKDIGDDKEKKAIFEVFLDKERDGSKKSPWIVPKSQIADECTSMQAAGSDTVANACMTGTFHLLRNRRAFVKLQKELDGLGEGSMNYETLEKLPYLTAVIKESLRLSNGVSSPLPRVVGPSGSTIAGITVPPGTVVSSASYVVHTNPSVFPDPHEFIPERWLNNRDLDKYLVAFSKGPRTCLGINLAWCELYMIFANVFRRLDLEIHDTIEEDLKFRDFYLPVFPGKHLRVFVKPRTTK